MVIAKLFAVQLSETNAVNRQVMIPPSTFEKIRAKIEDESE
jgi:hypothetical protein